MVKLVTEGGVGVSQASWDLDVEDTVQHRRTRELTPDPQQAFPGKGVMKLEQAKIDRLRKEVAKLKMQRDISKKSYLSPRWFWETISLHCSRAVNPSIIVATIEAATLPDDRPMQTATQANKDPKATKVSRGDKPICL